MVLRYRLALLWACWSYLLKQFRRYHRLSYNHQDQFGRDYPNNVYLDKLLWDCLWLQDHCNLYQQIRMATHHIHVERNVVYSQKILILHIVQECKSSHFLCSWDHCGYSSLVLMDKIPFGRMRIKYLTHHLLPLVANHSPIYPKGKSKCLLGMYF